jgi:hypothetical protein
MHVYGDFYLRGLNTIKKVLLKTFREQSLKVFDLLEAIHLLLACRRGNTFLEFDLVGSSTNHNHEEIIENIETYQCVARKSL